MMMMMKGRIRKGNMGSHVDRMEEIRNEYKMTLENI
jgi:hypothetical protein